MNITKCVMCEEMPITKRRDPWKNLYCNKCGILIKRHINKVKKRVIKEKTLYKYIEKYPYLFEFLKPTLFGLKNAPTKPFKRLNKELLSNKYKPKRRYKLEKNTLCENCKGPIGIYSRLGLYMFLCNRCGLREKVLVKTALRNEKLLQTIFNDCSDAKLYFREDVYKLF